MSEHFDKLYQQDDSGMFVRRWKPGEEPTENPDWFRFPCPTCGVEAGKECLEKVSCMERVLLTKSQPSLAITLLADVMHLWIDGYISKSPDSCAPESVSSELFNKIEEFLATQNISVDYMGWRVETSEEWQN